MTLISQRVRSLAFRASKLRRESDQLIAYARQKCAAAGCRYGAARSGFVNVHLLVSPKSGQAEEPQADSDRETPCTSIWIRTLFAIFAAIVFVSANTRIGVAQDATPRLHALLIGCSKYDSIKPLNGPANDVEMTAATLAAPPYLIPNDRLKTLSSIEDGAAQPTRKNILREFESLRKNAKRGDQVLILMAGHGTQVANDNPDEDWEPDGLDEVFLPVDASFKSAAEFGLRDDMIGELLDELRDKGVFVFLVVDSCFSGTMSRSPIVNAMKLAIRCVDGPKQGVSVTETSALGFGLKSNRGGKRSSNAEDVGVVILYACPSGGKAIEQSLPPQENFGGIWHGRLTWKINEILNSATTPLTYRELELRIRWEFAREKWMPMPWLSGTSPDRTFLGVTEYSDRSRITLAKSHDGRFTIDAGILHNMHKGSVLDVRSLVGDEESDSSRPRIRVAESHPLFSYVEKLAGEAGSVSVPARCTLVERGIPEHRLRVAITREKGIDSEADQEQYDALTLALKKAVDRKKSLLAPARIDAADLILIHRQDKYFLETPDSLLAKESALNLPSFGPFELGDGDASEYVEMLECQFTSAARASLLRRIAITDTENIKNGGFKAHIVLHRRRSGEDGWSTMSKAGETVLEDDIIRVQVANIDTRAFDVNMLYLDSAFEITSFFPSKRQVMKNRWITRLDPGEKTPPVQFRISTENVGLDDLMILLTSSTGGKGCHFLGLEQDGIDNCRVDSAATERNVGNNNTKLGALLQELLFSTTDRRSIPLTNLRELAVQRLSWYVRRDTELVAK